MRQRCSPCQLPKTGRTREVCGRTPPLTVLQPIPILRRRKLSKGISRLQSGMRALMASGNSIIRQNRRRDRKFYLTGYDVSSSGRHQRARQLGDAGIRNADLCECRFRFLTAIPLSPHNDDNPVGSYSVHSISPHHGADARYSFISAVPHQECMYGSTERKWDMCRAPRNPAEFDITPYIHQGRTT